MATEKRLIDANALKERAIRVSTVKEHCYFKAVGTREIDKAPTVDAVEVVRCKDCKHYGYEPYDNGDKCCECWGAWIFPHEEDFCSCGERKDNELV